MSPENTEFVQNYLSTEYNTIRQAKCGAECPPLWKDVAEHFNGFNFAINITAIKPASFRSSWGFLMDPSHKIVGQEDRLWYNMRKHGLRASIALYSYIFHFKSITVVGDKNKRENVTKFHFNNTDWLPHSYYDILHKVPDQLISKYPKRHRFPYFLFVVPESDQEGDKIYISIFNLASHLRFQYDLEFRIIRYKRDAIINCYDVDILVIASNICDPTRVVHAKPNLIKVALMQFDFTSWLSRFWLGNFDLILSSSVLAYNLMSPVN